MSDLPTYSDAGDETSLEAGSETIAGKRQWKITLMIVIAIILAVVVFLGLHLTGVIGATTH